MTTHKNNPTKKQLLTKIQQKQLKTLTQEVHKSRIAVQHISKNCQEQQKLNKTFESIKSQINQCVLQINSEQRKQDVLKELVHLLKGEMNKMEVKDVETKRKDDMELDKQVKQMRDDIDRIFLKKNHEVAKIAQLKQLANQRRSQRVVYSSLFKKIQKELKQSEEIYKNEILRSEKSKLDIEMSSSEKSKVKMSHQIKPSSLFSSFFNEFEQHSPRQPTQKNQKDIHQHTCKQFFKNESLKLRTVMSHEQQLLDPSIDPSFYIHSQAQVNSVRPSTRIDKATSSREYINGFEIVAEQLCKFSERIKAACGASSIEQIKEMMANIEDENEKIEEDIRLINQQIEIGAQKNSIASKQQYRRQLQELQYEEFQQNLSLNLSWIGAKNQTVQKKCNKNILQASNITAHQNEKCKKNQNEQIFSTFNEICDIFSQANQEDPKKKKQKVFRLNSSQLNEQCQQLDTIICDLFQPKQRRKQTELLRHSSSLKQNENEDKQNRIREEKSTELNGILTKMGRYGHCQKFLGRDEFYQEYHKEINKKTKFRSKRL